MVMVVVVKNFFILLAKLVLNQLDMMVFTIRTPKLEISRYFVICTE